MKCFELLHRLSSQPSASVLIFFLQALNLANTQQYPTFSNAESCFDVTNYIHQATGFSIHGPYPPAPILPRDALYFGQVSRKVRVPSASIFAALLFFTRQETLDPAIPPHLIAARRQTREVADALQQVGPTLDDIEHFIHRCRTKFADFPATDVGVMERGTTASLSSTMESPALYKVGTLTGSWQGSYIVSAPMGHRWTVC